MVVRYANPEDMEQVVALCQEHARFEGTEVGRDLTSTALSSFIFTSGQVKCLVVEQGKQVVGYATFMIQFSTWNAAYYLYLDCLFLKEEVRGKGMGVEMMEEIRKYAIAHNLTLMEWQTPCFNTGAIRFYHRLGAESRPKERFFWDVE